MNILIEIKDKKVKIKLLQGRKEVDFLDITDEYQLSERLLPEIDQFLSKNNLKPEKINKINIKTDQNDNFTSTRIVKSVINTWNWVKTVD